MLVTAAIVASFNKDRNNYQAEVSFFRLILICLFVVFRPTREFFTHMETSPMPVKGCKFLPIMLDTHGH